MKPWPLRTPHPPTADGLGPSRESKRTAPSVREGGEEWMPVREAAWRCQLPTGLLCLPPGAGLASKKSTTRARPTGSGITSAKRCAAKCRRMHDVAIAMDDRFFPRDLPDSVYAACSSFPALTLQPVPPCRPPAIKQSLIVFSMPPSGQKTVFDCVLG